jgi:hypothetical protein
LSSLALDYIENKNTTCLCLAGRSIHDFCQLLSGLREKLKPNGCKLGVSPPFKIVKGLNLQMLALKNVMNDLNFTYGEII